MTTMEYKYRLAPYRGKASRHTCPACERPHCFTLYIDADGTPLDRTVGRCNHESSCAYHKTPADYFREHPELCRRNSSARIEETWRQSPDWLKPQPAHLSRPGNTGRSEENVCILPPAIVEKTLRLNPESTFITFLRTLFDDATIRRLAHQYRLGVARDLAAVFYQTDHRGRTRSGKIIRYNPATGHRIKDDDAQPPVDWVHTRLKRTGQLPQSWHLTQCLFGEHLLPRHPDATVCLVEAEKTAVICAGFLPDYLWLATGGKTQLGDRLDILRGRRIIAFPDMDAYDTWTEKLLLRKDLSVLVSDYLLATATELERSTGADIADRLIAYHCHPGTACHPEPNEKTPVSSSRRHTDMPIHPIQAIQSATESFSLHAAAQYVSPESLLELKSLITDLDLTLNTITRIQTP